MENICPLQPKQKLFKEQKNQSRKQDLKPETGKIQQTDGHEDDKRRPVITRHVVQVDVEINSVGLSDVQKTPSHPVKSCSKQKPSRKLSSSPSQASVISDTAAEELCDLRNYYSRQLRRINYISHEYLGQPAEPGVLACIREPLKSLRLPGRTSIAQTARSLWTRVSSRRKLLHR